MKRVIGIGCIFFKSKDPKALGAGYKKILDIDVEDWGGFAFQWNISNNPQGVGSITWSPPPRTQATVRRARPPSW